MVLHANHSWLNHLELQQYPDSVELVSPFQLVMWQVVLAMLV